MSTSKNCIHESPAYVVFVYITLVLFSLLVFGRSFCPDKPELLIKLNTTRGLQVETRIEAKLLYLITHYSIFTVCLFFNPDEKKVPKNTDCVPFLMQISV